jgi:hypothetical protein
MSPAMYVPVPFVFWMNFTSLTMFLGEWASSRGNVFLREGA